MQVRLPKSTVAFAAEPGIICLNNIRHINGVIAVKSLRQFVLVRPISISDASMLADGAPLSKPGHRATTETDHPRYNL